MVQGKFVAPQRSVLFRSFLLLWDCFSKGQSIVHGRISELFLLKCFYCHRSSLEPCLNHVGVSYIGFFAFPVCPSLDTMTILCYKFLCLKGPSNKGRLNSQFHGRQWQSFANKIKINKIKNCFVAPIPLHQPIVREIISQIILHLVLNGLESQASKSKWKSSGARLCSWRLSASACLLANLVF